MKLIYYPKSDYLLAATLESLHAESVRWLNELAIWTDEMSSVYHRVYQKTLSKTSSTLEMANVEMELVKLSRARLNNVKTGIESHERLLVTVYKSASCAEEQVYREVHKNLLEEMHFLDQEINKYRTKRLFTSIMNKIVQIRV